MLPLSEIIRAAQDDVRDASGVVNHRLVAERVIDELAPEVMRERGISGLVRMSKQLAERQLSDIVGADQPDLPFSELHGAYAVTADDDGRDVASTKKTGDLSRLDFERAIRIREDQVSADTKHLNVMKNVLRVVSPIWDRNPEWVFAQVCRAWSEEQRKAA